MKNQLNTDPKTIKFTPPHEIKAIFWDIDGTLVDSEPIHEKAWIRVLAEHDVHLQPIDFIDLVGTSFEKKTNILCDRYNIDRKHIKDWAVKKYDYFDELVSGIELMNDRIPDILGYIKNKGLIQAAVSNGNKRTVNNNIAILDQGLFDFILSIDDVEKGKPDPAPYFLAAKMAKIEPQNCLVIEDSLTGVQAGLAAGMTTIACPYSQSFYQKHKDEYDKADIVIERIDDLNWTDLLK